MITKKEARKLMTENHRKEAESKFFTVNEIIEQRARDGFSGAMIELSNENSASMLAKMIIEQDKEYRVKIEERVGAHYVIICWQGV